MLGKTHIAVGTGSALLLMHPADITGLVLGTGAAVIGSVLPDIDVGTSESHKDADKVILMSVGAVAGMVIVESSLHLGLWQRILSDTNAIRICIAIALFIGICMFGKEQPHRSFMHSIPALVVITGCVTVFLPMMAPYFGIGFFSHMAIDLLNKKGQRLLYPFRKRFKLNLCSSRGKVNRIMFRVGSVVTVVLIIALAARIVYFRYF